MVGKIYLVGIGPGDPELMTVKAKKVLKRAQVVVVHGEYLHQISELVRGKKVITEGTTPPERAGIAVEKAMEGKTVAIAISGDPNVYAIANILLQHIREKHLKVPVEVVPGVTAALATAACLGAPLGGDFAMVSLGETTTPWEEIERRLTRASEADLVVVLYNPTGGEGWRIRRAMEAMMESKRADTPVGIVRAVTLPQQSVEITTLDKLVECNIDALTTIIVGNSDTFVHNGRLVTPRTYDHGY